MIIDNFETLQKLLQDMPEGATSNVLGSDLEAGNVHEVHFELPNGEAQDITYTGPVDSSYVSPFDGNEEEDV